MYKLNDLQQAYGSRIVLNIRSMEIGGKDLFAIVGPSGAGKSTLLRLLHLLEKPAAGWLQFSLGGRAYGFPAPLEVRRQIGMVFQRPEVVDGSVWDNAAIGLRLRGIYDSSLVREALDAVELSDLAGAPVHTLSGGELQRVALARVMAYSPSVYLLDEPTANLDPRNVALVERIIQKMRARGSLVVLVTHNVYQARRLADQVGLLLSGELVEVSPVDRFFEAPRDPRSAAFVRGEMIY